MPKKSLSKTDIATIESLEARRLEQEQLIATLRAHHTQSILDGLEYDSTAIRAAEDELKAIQTAQITLHELQKERERQDKEALEKLTDQDRRDRVADGIDKMRHDWLADVEIMENSAREMMAAYKRAKEQSRSLHIALMSQGVTSMHLMPSGFPQRASDGLAAIMTKNIGDHGFGNLKIPAVVRDPDLPWTHAERPASIEIDQLLATLRFPQFEGRAGEACA